MEDVTDLLPDQAIRVTSWAEDGRYVYLGGVIPNRQVYVLQIEKISRSRINTYVLNHSTVDWVTVGIKWGKIYAVTTAKENDNESFSQQTWQWWRVESGNWANLASTQHCEGGGSHELVETNNFLFYIGGYSTCGAWGIKGWRLNAAEKISSWSSPTGDIYYYLTNAVTTGNRVLFSHFPAGGRTIFFEDLLEESNDFLRSYTDTGYQGDWAGIWDNGRMKVIFSGITQYDGGSVHIRDYPRTLDKRIYSNRSALLQAWSRNDGITYLLLRDDVARQLLVLQADMALNIEDDGARYPLGDFWGAKLMRANEFNPGFVWNALDGRVYIVSERGAFAGALGKEAQLTNFPRGAMDPILKQMADGSLWLVGHYQENWQPFYTISRDGGQNWSQPTLLWDGAVYDMDMAQGPDGRIWVAWASSSPDPYDPHFRTTADGGKTWADVRRLNAPPDHDTVLSVIPFSATETWLCWEGGCITSGDSGQGWGSVRTMPVFGWNNTTFSRTRDGRLWAVTVTQTGDYETGKALIQLRWSRDKGQNWSPLTTVSSAPVAPKTREPIRPVARLLEDSGGRLWLVFYAYESRTDSSQVWYMTSNDGVEWSYPYPVTTDPSFHASYFSNISLAEVNGQVWAVYASDKSGKWQVYRQVLAL